MKWLLKIIIIISKKCPLRSLSEIWSGNVLCTFVYSHTGSGKTHTMLDCGSQIPGMYRLTADYIFDQLSLTNKENNKVHNNNTKKDEILLEASFSELYRSKMCDLFSPQLVECFIRESNDGIVNSCDQNRLEHYFERVLITFADCFILAQRIM